MATFEQLRHAAGMYDYCEESDLGHGLSKSSDLRHFKCIEDALSPDEQVFTVFGGFYHEGISTAVTNYHVYAITSKRIIMAQKHFISSVFQTISLKNINDITYTKSLFWSTITIDTAKEKFSLAVKEPYGYNIHFCIGQALDMAKQHNEPSAQAPQNVGVQSLSDELMALKQLVDTGILTQDEFDAKKKQMLGI